MTRILLVEDSELNSDMLSRRLIKRGYEVDVATDGREGICMADTCSPDLILLDLSLPEMDGFEVLKHLKQDSRMKNIPVIALTAHALVTDRHRALAAGFDDYDIKPIEMPRLLQKMNTLLSKEAAL
jgi:two-component system, cell cycle response regulator DivK